MPILKISKQYLIDQDDESITVDVPESVLTHWQHDAEMVIADQVREKLEPLELTEQDIADAVNWARQG